MITLKNRSDKFNPYTSIHFLKNTFEMYINVFQSFGQIAVYGAQIYKLDQQLSFRSLSNTFAKCRMDI